jgi:hypothetical protein
MKLHFRQNHPANRVPNDQAGGSSNKARMWLSLQGEQRSRAIFLEHRLRPVEQGADSGREGLVAGSIKLGGGWLHPKSWAELIDFSMSHSGSMNDKDISHHAMEKL